MEAYKVFTDALAKELAERTASPEVKDAIESIKAAAETGGFECVISTADLDRQGEVVLQDGWDLSRYLLNPVVLWAHDYYSLPIGVCDEVSVINGKLTAKGRFAPEAANPFAQQVRRLYDAGIVRATSVGFMPTESDGPIIKSAELLEFSFVPVPANPMALSLRDILGMNLNVPMLAMKGITMRLKDEEATPPAETVTPTPEPVPPVEEPAPVVEPPVEPAPAEVTPEPAPEGTQDAPETTGEPDTVVTPPADAETPPAPTGEPAAPEETEVKAVRARKDAAEDIAACISQLTTVVAALQGIADAMDAQGGEGDEPVEPQGNAAPTPKQRSSTVGTVPVDEALKAFLDSRSILKVFSTAIGEHLARMNAQAKALR